MEIKGQIMIYTGYENRKSKTGNDYNLVKFLENNGDSISCMTTVDPVTIGKLVQFEKYKCDFDLQLGRYTRLTLISITPYNN